MPDRSRTTPELIPMNLLTSDRFLDAVLDHLAHRERLVGNLARWDLKAALVGTIQKVYGSGA